MPGVVATRSVVLVNAPREGKVRRRALLAVALIIGASVPLLYLTSPTVKTPALFRTRGVSWTVSVEDPIPAGAVTALIGVFSAEVEDILGIPVVSAEFVVLP